jgi:MFS family permease
MAAEDRRAELGDHSVTELLERLSKQIPRLVQDEIRLARLELQDKGKRVGIGAGMFGSGGLLALYAGGAIVASLVLLLSLAVEAWIAALIVGIILLAIAGFLGLVGKKRMQQAAPLVPEETVQSVKQDIDAVKEAAKRRGQGT